MQVVENITDSRLELELKTVDGMKYASIVADESYTSIERRKEYDKYYFTPSSKENGFVSVYSEREINGIPAFIYESGYERGESYRYEKGGRLSVYLYLDKSNLIIRYASSDGVVDGKLTYAQDGLDGILSSLKRPSLFDINSKYGQR